MYSVVSAIVAERGGLLAHTAALAREYGIPAIFGVEHATERIHNGEELLVDANQGLVMLRRAERDWELL